MFAAISVSKPSAQVLSQVVLHIALSGHGYVRSWAFRASLPFRARQKLSQAEGGPWCLPKLLEHCRRLPERDVEGCRERILQCCGLLSMGKRRRFGVQRTYAIDHEQESGSADQRGERGAAKNSATARSARKPEFGAVKQGGERGAAKKSATARSARKPEFGAVKEETKIR